MDFPAPPQVIHPPGISGADTYVVRLGDTLYLAVVTSTQGSRETDDEILGALQVGRSFGEADSIRDMGAVSLPGARAGRAFLAQNAAKGIVCQGRLFWANNRLYTVTVTTPVRRADAPEISRFLDSFRLLGPADSPVIAQTEPETVARRPAPPVASGVNPFDDPSDFRSQRTADVAKLDTVLADLDSDSQPRKTLALSQLCTVEIVEERREEVAARLIPVLADPEPMTRMMALRAAAVWCPEAAIPGAISMLEDRDHMTRREALKLLGRTKDRRAIEAVAAHWAADDNQVFGDRLIAAEALAAIGPAAEETLLQYLGSQDRQSVADACTVLGKIGTKKSLPRLAVLARSQDLRIRTSAQKASQNIMAANRTPEAPLDAVAVNPFDDAASGDVAAAASDAPDASAADMTAPAADTDAVTSLLTEMEKNPALFQAAAEQLAKLDLDSQSREEAAKGLMTMLSEKDDDVRVAALMGLGICHTPESIAAVAALLDDDSLQVRRAAFNSLAITKSPLAAEELAKRLGGNSASDASRSLQAMGPAAEDAVLKCLDQSSVQVRLLACRTLAQIGTERSLAPLQALSNAPDIAVANAAAQAIAAIKSRQ